MDDIDRTYEALMRSPFNKVVEEIYAADPFGSMTFNCMNADKVWRVQSSYESIVIDNGWAVNDFNEELHKRYNE